jgi:hypothetical protein
MSYVRTDTSNILGRRGLARLGKLSWGDSAPYPVYGVSRAVARLNGQFNPPGADPSTNANGAITYRIDPQTGQYRFYSTDIKPRGVFAQNMYQPPAPPLMSPLGVPIGKSPRAPQQRGRRFAPRARSLNGLGCNCGGRCSRANLSRLSGMGEADFPGACGPQSDGTIIPCGPDTAGATEQGDVSLPGVKPTVIAPPPGSQITSFEPGNPSLPGFTISPSGVVISVTGSKIPVQPTPSWWNGFTMIGNSRVANPALAVGVVGVAALLSSMGGKRR